MDIKVTDRKSFIEFLEAFLQDYKSHGDAWENNTMETFLEAMAAYAADVQGYYNNMEPGINADIPTWKVFADILRGAAIYE